MRYTKTIKKEVLIMPQNYTPENKECQTSPDIKTEYDNMKEFLRLKRENEELRKENLFLKKAAAFFAKEIG